MADSGKRGCCFSGTPRGLAPAATSGPGAVVHRRSGGPSAVIPVAPQGRAGTQMARFLRMHLLGLPLKRPLRVGLSLREAPE